MRKQFLKIALLFTILTGPIEIVSAQPSTPDSCICYTDLQDIRCLECLINAPKRDSINSAQRDFIAYQETVIEKAWKTRDKAIKNKKRSTIIGSSAGGVGGLFLGYLTFKLLSK